MSARWTVVALGCWIAAVCAKVGVAQPVSCEDFDLETFTATGAVETSTVPTGAGQVEIRAIGGGGGDSIGPDAGGDTVPILVPGGIGVPMRARFPVTPGELLNIVVGEQGEDASEPGNDGGGGGGSFVYRTANLAGMLIAAGGGGSGLGLSVSSKNASATTTAFAGTGTGPGAAGTGGSGGAGSANAAGGAGGGGLLTPGGAGGSGAVGGASLAAGAAPGVGCCSGQAGDGGFGGGGGGGDGGGAGGGGFNGGGGGGAGGDGGGGSSFISAAGTTLSTDIAPIGPSDGIVFLCYSEAVAQPVPEIPALSPASLAMLAVFLVAVATALLRRAQR